MTNSYCLSVLKTRSLGQCQRGRFLPEAGRENLFPVLPLASHGWLVMFGAPGLQIYCPNLCLHVQMALSLCVCLYIQIPPFYKNTNHAGFELTLRPHFNLITSVLYFQIRSYSEVLGFRASLYLFLGNYLTYNSHETRAQIFIKKQAISGFLKSSFPLQPSPLAKVTTLLISYTIN